MEEAEKMGTLKQILEESGFSTTGSEQISPKFISVQRVTVPLSLRHVKA